MGCRPNTYFPRSSTEQLLIRKRGDCPLPVVPARAEQNLRMKSIGRPGYTICRIVCRAKKSYAKQSVVCLASEESNPIDRSYYNSGFANKLKKTVKTPDLPMKYSRMLFQPKNDTLLVNILSVIEHSVKNIENVKFPWHF